MAYAMGQDTRDQLFSLMNLLSLTHLGMTRILALCPE